MSVSFMAGSPYASLSFRTRICYSLCNNSLVGGLQMFRRRLSLLLVSTFLVTLPAQLFASQQVPEVELSQRVAQLVEANDAAALRDLGPEAIASMVWLYELS